MDTGRLRRVGGPSAIAGAGLMLVGAAYFILDDVDYQGGISSNLIPQWLGIGAAAIGALLLYVAMWVLLPAGVSTGYGRWVLGLAGGGILVGAVPVWPVFPFGWLLWSIAALLLGIAGIRHGGPRIPAWVIAVVSPIVAFSGPWGLAAVAIGIAAWGVSVMGRGADVASPRSLAGGTS